METYTLATAGQFRANPDATVLNDYRLVDPDTPGTPATDTLTSYDAAAAGVIQGIKYTGKDGVEVLIQFFRTIAKTGQRIPYDLPASTDAKTLQDAIFGIITSHEVDAVVSVTKTGTSFTISHTGSGTINSLVVDGADVDFTRAAVSGVAIAADAPSEESDEAGADVKAETTGGKKSKKAG